MKNKSGIITHLSKRNEDNEFNCFQGTIFGSSNIKSYLNKDEEYNTMGETMGSSEVKAESVKDQNVSQNLDAEDLGEIENEDGLGQNQITEIETTEREETDAKRRMDIKSAINALPKFKKTGVIDKKVLEPLVLELCQARKKFKTRMDTSELDAEPELHKKMRIIRDMAIPFYVKDMLRTYYKVRFSKMKVELKSDFLIRYLKIFPSLDTIKDIFTPYKNTIKMIEGKFNFSVAAYFRFLRWLIMVNLLTLLVPIFLLLIPIIISTTTPYHEIMSYKNKRRHGMYLHELVTKCSKLYEIDTNPTNLTLPANILNNIQGQGLIENTYLYYGSLQPSYRLYNFDFSLGFNYLLHIILSFMITMIMIVIRRNRLKTFESSDSRNFKYSELILGSYNFCINNREKFKLNTQVHRRTVITLLKIDKDELKQKELNAKGSRIFIIRIVVHFTVIIILLMTILTCYYVTFITNTDRYSEVLTLKSIIRRYIPPLTLTVINMCVPDIYTELMAFEEYDGNQQLYNSLIRIITLRLTTLFFYLLAVFRQSKCKTYDECNVPNAKQCNINVCWESHMYEMIHQLGVVDLSLVFVKCLIFDSMKRMYVDKYGNKSYVQLTTFNTPVRIAHVVYHQILCWFGLIFSPLSALSAIIRVAFIFYSYKFNLLHNLKTSSWAYEHITPHLQITNILMIGFIFSYWPLIYILMRWLPSTTCGLFRFDESIVENFGFSKKISTLLASGQIIFLLTFLSVVIIIFIFTYVSKSQIENSTSELEINIQKRDVGIANNIIQRRLNENKKTKIKNKRLKIKRKKKKMASMLNKKKRKQNDVLPWDEVVLRELKLTLNFDNLKQDFNYLMGNSSDISAPLVEETGFM